MEMGFRMTKTQKMTAGSLSINDLYKHLVVTIN